MWLLQAGSVLPTSQVEARPLPKRHQKGEKQRKMAFSRRLGFCRVCPSPPPQGPFLWFIYWGVNLYFLCSRVGFCWVLLPGGKRWMPRGQRPPSTLQPGATRDPPARGKRGCYRHPPPVGRTGTWGASPERLEPKGPELPPRRGAPRGCRRGGDGGSGWAAPPGAWTWVHVCSFLLMYVLPLYIYFMYVKKTCLKSYIFYIGGYTYIYSIQKAKIEYIFCM